MILRPAFLLLLLFCMTELAAFDRQKSAQELETVTVVLPGKAVRSYKLKHNTPYAVSALISASEPDIAGIEVRLFSGGKQLRFLRSMRNGKGEERLETVFNSENADRAEVALAIREDAMPQSKAVFREYRFVSCDNSVIQVWDKRPPNNCRRVITPQGDIILFPVARRGSGNIYSVIEKIVPDTRMQFSADVTSELPGAAFLQVVCSGNSALKPKVFNTKSNSAVKQHLSVSFDTGKYKWISLRLCCNNGKKFSNRKVIFKNVRVIPAPEQAVKAPEAVKSEKIKSSGGRETQKAPAEKGKSK